MAQPPVFRPSLAQTLAPGQVWQYHTREGEESSTVVINAIEQHPDYDYIIHTSIHGLNIGNLKNGDTITQISHIPVSLPSLEKSLTELINMVDPAPTAEEGYQAWKSAFEEGQAGVFLISVADIISIIERSFHPLQ